MKVLNKNIKEKPVIATLLFAVIIGLICLNIFILRYYQVQTELPPKLIAVTEDGKEIELLPVSYDWIYNGEEKSYNIGLSEKELKTYDFNGNYTIYAKYDFGIEYTNIKTSPKYKAKGFTSYYLRYQTLENDYIPENTVVLEDQNRTSTKRHMGSDTNIVVITLYSKTQGQAVYAYKTINSYYIDINEVKEIGSLEFNKDKISNYMKEQFYGKYLNNVEIENNKLILQYDYFIDKRAMNVYSNVLFALIDNLEEIEYRFSYDKYTENYWDQEKHENIKTNYDNLDPYVYKREGFRDEYLDLSLDELKTFLGK